MVIVMFSIFDCDMFIFLFKMWDGRLKPAHSFSDRFAGILKSLASSLRGAGYSFARCIGCTSYSFARCIGCTSYSFARCFDSRRGALCNRIGRGYCSLGYCCRRSLSSLRHSAGSSCCSRATVVAAFSIPLAASWNAFPAPLITCSAALPVASFTTDSACSTSFAASPALPIIHLAPSSTNPKPFSAKQHGSTDAEMDASAPKSALRPRDWVAVSLHPSVSTLPPASPPTIAPASPLMDPPTLVSQIDVTVPCASAETPAPASAPVS